MIFGLFCLIISPPLTYKKHCFFDFFKRLFWSKIRIKKGIRNIKCNNFFNDDIIFCTSLTVYCWTILFDYIPPPLQIKKHCFLTILYVFSGTTLLQPISINKKKEIQSVETWKMKEQGRNMLLYLAVVSFYS